MSMKKKDRALLDRTGELLDYDGVREAMRYLGYRPGARMDATARRLAGKMVVSVSLPKQIGDEYAKNETI